MNKQRIIAGIYAASSFIIPTQIISIDPHHTQITAINTVDVPKPIGPFSQAILVRNPKRILHTSGQLPIDPTTNELKTTPAEATEQCMQNLKAILQSANMSFENVIKTTIILKNMSDFPVVNKVYESFLKPPYPARITFQVAALPKDACVEIEMIAIR